MLDPWWERHPCSADAPAPLLDHVRDRSAGSGADERRHAARGSRPVDCGTNSIRLLVADVGADGRLVDVVRRMEIVRLGQGIDRTGVIAPEAMERTLAMSRASTPSSAGRSGSSGCGSSRPRRRATPATPASSSPGSARRSATSTSRPRSSAGDTEARFSFTGATGDLRALGLPGPYLVVDLGGGSTELVARHDRRRGGALGRRRLRADDRAAPALRPADARRGGRGPARRRAALDAVEEVVDLTGIGAVVGLAGTITTITAHALDLPTYDPERIHLARVPAADHREACAVLLAMRHDERAALPYMHPGRVDVIGGGALVWGEVLERVLERSPGAVVVTSEHDILDGIALSLT